jgi:histidine phosphotransferase ChpT
MVANRNEPGLAMRDKLHLAEILAIRLCHDLSGPLGTLMGALELLSEDPESAAEAVPLAHEVSQSLGKRLRLARAAWGGATPAMNVAELAAMAEGLHQRRVTVNLDGLDPAHVFPPMAARMVLNVLMLAAESLPAGGVVSLTGDRGDVIAAISGPRNAWPSGLAAMLADEDHAWNALRLGSGAVSSRGLQAPLTALIAHAGGLRLSLLMAPSAEAAPPLLLGLSPR